MAQSHVCVFVDPRPLSLPPPPSLVPSTLDYSPEDHRRRETQAACNIRSGWYLKASDARKTQAQHPGPTLGSQLGARQAIAHRASSRVELVRPHRAPHQAPPKRRSPIVILKMLLLPRQAPRLALFSSLKSFLKYYSPNHLALPVSSKYLWSPTIVIVVCIIKVLRSAYWSRDPSGAECLSAGEAKNEGFPDIDCCMWAVAGSWDAGVYTGIRQFHEAKGFDPYSQELATKLGYPLYQVSCEGDDLSEPLQESNKEDDYSDSNGGNGFPHSDDQESGTEARALRATVLAGDTEINTYEHEDFLSDLHQTDERNATTPLSTPPVNPLSGSTESARNGRKRSYPAAFRDEEYGNSDELADGQAPRSKRAPILSSGFLPREALSLDGIIPTSFASSSRVTPDNVCFSSNFLPSTVPLEELDDLVDPLRDLDAAEVDAVMILSQLGARS
ncbi:hypothetical protein C8F04DRAFT_1331606 [Mycena alexandri]|uniref:Uncharacterized protein n=1 Tax=Mycena alexandri TaxID=1745969 RepID=A0AAD6T061_9AGAR|nr:hypothetical protein C8F04DRAFT_1331606 [Mycena alexandri]